MYWNKRFFIFLLFFVGISACSRTPETPLPTAVAPANRPHLENWPETPGDEDPSTGPPPATWTPGPTPEGAAEEAWLPLVANQPTPRPTVPSRTPRPPTATPTPEATATPTRYVSQIPYELPPTDELGPSKVGLHVIQNNDPAIMEFVREAKPAVMKSVGDYGFLAEVKQVSPRTITIGRFPADHQDIDGNPEEAARQFVAKQLPYYEANPYVDYWEGWNEPDPNLDGMAWYARFEQERVREMARYGYRAAIGGFAAGVPEMDEFALFLPAVETALEHNGILSLHEYGAPTLDYLYGDPLPGYPAYPDRGSLTFRYRWFYREYLEPAGLVIPLVITEMGIDGIIGGRPGPNGLGWRDFQSYWVEQGGWGNNGVEAYINQLAWYDAGVRQDGYVIGFTIFTAGGGDRWRSYEVNGILPQLTGYARSQW
ncbi:MAG: hypothetical protein ACOC8X_02720 [Chloroflexota bacterium]